MVNVILMHGNALTFSGIWVLRMLTRPLAVPGPWGLPGLYQVYAGTRLKTSYHFHTMGKNSPPFKVCKQMLLFRMHVLWCFLSVIQLARIF